MAKSDLGLKDCGLTRGLIESSSLAPPIRAPPPTAGRPRAPQPQPPLPA